MADAKGKKRNQDLGQRVASALVMSAVAGLALWIGGRVLAGFIILVAIACLVEMVRLVQKAAPNMVLRVAGWILGAAYVAFGALGLISLKQSELLLVLGLVIATDTGAYFMGRTLGGPKIAPKISPSKTWAGLFGGMLAASVWMAAATYVMAAASDSVRPTADVIPFALGGAALAVAAQAGDFLESWLKRKAGVKDSSNLIPGHGGVFDRVDGLLPVAILVGLALSFLR